LRSRNAIGYWEDCFPPVVDRSVSAILPRAPQANLLLPYVWSLHITFRPFAHEPRLCTGTMSEIEKALAELKALMAYRAEELGHEEEFRGLGLTSRKNLCLHPSVKREKSGSVVDARCRSLTAGFVKEKKDRGEDVDVCVYHDVRMQCVFGRPSTTNGKAL